MVPSPFPSRSHRARRSAPDHCSILTNDLGADMTEVGASVRTAARGDEADRLRTSAAVVNTAGAPFEIEELEISRPLGREVLVEVKASGLCHSDLTFARSGMGYPPPVVLGHEVAGVVTEVGPEVTTHAVGDHVVASLIQFCGTCATCLSGRTYQCPVGGTLRAPEEAPRLSRDGEAITQGLGLGGFAQRALIHERQLVTVPKTLPFALAALLGCAVVTGAGAVINTANVQAGQTVVVIGAGGVGLNAISGAVIAGAAHIVAVDVHDAKLELARAFGATHVVNSAKADPVELVRDLGGADAVFDLVGAKAVTEQALEMLVKGGALYLIGAVGMGERMDLDIIGMIAGQRRIQGVNMGSSNIARDIPMYADLYLGGRMNLDGLVSKEISLAEINDGYAALEDPSIARVVITSF
ncbi:zinc-binding dehydrogenase [Georgenia sp. AZ-5]|uniref:zinc-binding dehydrogenase n=1 Tax=Georgenia sp. AZ-5 TaxID=3367526 RepID=UPI0037546F03